MGDLQLNGTVMGDLRKTFSTIADRMDGVSRSMGNTNGEAVGAPSSLTTCTTSPTTGTTA